MPIFYGNTELFSERITDFIPSDPQIGLKLITTVKVLPKAVVLNEGSSYDGDFTVPKSGWTFIWKPIKIET